MKSFLFFFIFFYMKIAFCQHTSPDLQFLNQINQLAQQPPDRQCMSRENLIRLNEIIICQQLSNPVQCDQAIGFLRQNAGIGSNAYDAVVDLEQQEHYSASAPITTEEIRNAAVAQLAVSGAERAPSVIRNSARLPYVLTEARRHNAIIQSVLTRASITGVLSDEDARVLSRSVEHLRSIGGLFPQYRNLPSALSPQEVRSVWQRLVQRFTTRGGVRGLAAAGGRGAAAIIGGPVGVGLFLFEVVTSGGRAVGALREWASGCTADNRNQQMAGYRCVTERCQPHYLACANTVGLAALPIEQQERALGSNTEPGPGDCEYMNNYLRIMDQPIDNIRINSCDNDSIGLAISGYREVDLRGSMSSPESAPSFSSPRDMEVTMRLEDNRLADMTVLGHFSGVNRLVRMEYAYDGQGNFENLQGFPTIEEAPQRDLSSLETMGADIRTIPQPNPGSVIFNRDSFIPHENTGLFGLANSFRPNDWWRNQAFVFQGRMGQIYHEARRCCWPQAGETCRLQMSESARRARPRQTPSVH